MRRASRFCVLFLFFALAGNAEAATRYLSPTGSDSNACSSTAPCASFTRAYTVAASGDTVSVAAGSYGAEQVPAGSKTVTFTGVPGTTLSEFDNSADNVTFDNINVDGGFAVNNTFENHGSNNVTYKNSSIGNVSDEKAALISGDNFTFDNMVFHDAILKTNGTHMECVYAIGVDGMTVRNSMFYNCAIMDMAFTYGDWWTPQPPAYGNVTIENNVFSHSTQTQGDPSWHYISLNVGATGPGGGTMRGWRVVNNTFENPANLNYAGSNSVWANNVGDWNCETGVTFSHNVGNKCVASDTQVSPAAGGPGNTPPYGWVNPANHDFHLASGSIAIGKADPLYAPAGDRDGNGRDASPDAGAYEYGAAGPPPPDTTPPDTSISSGPAAGSSTTSTSASFAFSSTESGSTFECRIDGGAWAACTSPKSYSGLAVASHTFDVRATDAAGNTDASPASRTWSVIADTTPPDTSITSGPAAGSSTTSTSASFGFSSTETPSTFECRLDGGAWASCTTPKSYTGLATGSHTFDVRAKDAAGNTDASPASRSWTVAAAPADTTPPDTSISSGPASPTKVTSATFAFASTESPSTYECQLDGGAWTACTSPQAYTGLAAGAHTFNVRAIDAAGNVDASPATQTWTVDTTAPNSTISSGPAAGSSTTATNAGFGFTSSESGSTFECQLDTAAWAACTSPKNYTNLAVGSHTFRVRATDAAGNVDGSPATRTWTVTAPTDTTAPNTSIGSGPANSGSTSATFTFASTEAGSTFQCQLDAGAWIACTSPKVYTGLTAATHTFQVRATDAAGNTDQSPAVYSWLVTPTLPQCSDGIDNDGDGKIDMLDPGCSSPLDDSESPDPTTPPVPPLPDPAPLTPLSAPLSTLSAPAADAAPVAPAPAATTAPKTGGLLAAFSFNEAKGASATDASVSKVSATVKGATRTASGRFGRALRFSDKTDRVSLAGAKLPANRTVEAWVRPDEADSMYTVLRALGGPTLKGRIDRTVAQDKWTHVAFVYAGQFVRIYLNGKQVTTVALPKGKAPSGNALGGNAFAGLVDEVRIWDGARNASQIRADMKTPI